MMGLQAIMAAENDPHVNALGIKGVCEIGMTGSAGAVANAVWQATGVRIAASDSRRGSDRAKLSEPGATGHFSTHGGRY